jgi:hypothetical protein
MPSSTRRGLRRRERRQRLQGARAAARAPYLRRPPEKYFFDRVCAHVSRSSTHTHKFLETLHPPPSLLRQRPRPTPMHRSQAARRIPLNSPGRDPLQNPH